MLASWGEAPKLRPCSDLQIGLCYHALGVILYNYTTENLRIFPKTTVLFVLPYTRGFQVITASKAHIQNNKFLPYLIEVFSLNVYKSPSEMTNACGH